MYLDDISYTNCKKMIEHRSRYHTLKLNIKELSIKIEDVF